MEDPKPITEATETAAATEVSVLSHGKNGLVL
jgi:hypothetical protein